MRESLAFVGFALLGGCGSREEPPAPSTGTPVFSQTASAEIAAAEERARLYGDDGVLLESEVFAGGVKLPRGLRERPEVSSPILHAYENDAAPRDLFRYFGPRVLTGNVQRQGERVTFRDAIARDAPVQSLRIDVSIYPVAGNKTWVEIRERRTVPVAAPRSPEEADRVFRESQAEAR